tara:strand:+ start:618 stop:770 length:153 start_codon:yes stop_codon:yes gene_type:complete
MQRVFKSDAEIDLNRCANALEKLVQLMESKQERGLATRTKRKPQAKEVKK